MAVGSTPNLAASFFLRSASSRSSLVRTGGRKGRNRLRGRWADSSGGASASAGPSSSVSATGCSSSAHEGSLTSGASARQKVTASHRKRMAGVIVRMRRPPSWPAGGHPSEEDEWYVEPPVCTHKAGERVRSPAGSIFRAPRSNTRAESAVQARSSPRPESYSRSGCIERFSWPIELYRPCRHRCA